MSFAYIRYLPLPSEIREELPVPEDIRAIKAVRDRVLKSVLEGNDRRFLVIIGPCSAHDEDAVLTYVERLAGVAEKTAKKLFIIPRIYTNKPRTLCLGYKGMMHQPDHHSAPNIVEGIKALRRMHLRAIAVSGLSAADEMLYPTNHPYLDDLLSYAAVGARSVENQQHRITASGVDIPVGMKNPVSGDLLVMLNSIQAAQTGHTFTYNGFEVETSGNPLAHAILRGAVDRFAQSIPNYHYEDLIRLSELYTERRLHNPAIIVDTNHANSGKLYAEQPRIALEILQSRDYNPALAKMVRGLMVESFLVEGSQSPEGTVFGQSITDPCLGWEATERLLYAIADRV
jgi:3-deoxy-7-phosphoheptulonate synthase